MQLTRNELDAVSAVHRELFRCNIAGCWEEVDILNNIRGRDRKPREPSGPRFHQVFLDIRPSLAWTGLCRRLSEAEASRLVVLELAQSA